jgi:carbamoyltransferase
MYILGISEIDNDAGAVLLKNAEVVCGINEERLTRIKRHRGFPHKSVEWILKYSNLSIENIDYIAIAKASPTDNPDRFYRVSNLLRSYDYFDKKDPSSFLVKTLNLVINKYRNAPKSIELAKKMNDEIDEWINNNNCSDKVIRVPHHRAHAECAYWASGFENALAVTMDGQGEGVTSQVYLVNNGEFSLLKEVRAPHSLGNFYAAVTKALGFKPARHEGKITGLAAYADQDPNLLLEIQKMAFLDSDGGFFSPSIYGNYTKIVKLGKKYGKEKISSVFQYIIEDITSKYISYYVEKYQVADIVLAGGVFGNVKLNQKIHEINRVNNIYVFPHMADGGLGYGAAQFVYREKSNDNSISSIKDVYWGPEYTNDEVKESLDRYGIKYKYYDQIEKEVALCLSKDKVVTHFSGRMEFGPRSLGNRSILYPATTPSVNNWLNHKLERSEFMPFAPVTLSEYADECYLNIKGAEKTSQFMTITFECTDKMKNQSPAVVHVDGTARPQLVSENINPRYYKILSEYYNLTGIPSIVNTSFNMHEEPIVCSPDDAITAFLQSELDYLAIGNFLVEGNLKK